MAVATSTPSGPVTLKGKPKEALWITVSFTEKLGTFALTRLRNVCLNTESRRQEKRWHRRYKTERPSWLSNVQDGKLETCNALQNNKNSSSSGRKGSILLIAQSKPALSMAMQWYQLGAHYILQGRFRSWRPPWGKETFVSLPWRKPMLAHWVYFDLCELYNWCTTALTQVRES